MPEVRLDTKMKVLQLLEIMLEAAKYLKKWAEANGVDFPQSDTLTRLIAEANTLLYKDSFDGNMKIEPISHLQQPHATAEDKTEPDKRIISVECDGWVDCSQYGVNLLLVRGRQVSYYFRKISRDATADSNSRKDNKT